MGRVGCAERSRWVLFASNMQCNWLSVQPILPEVSPPQNEAGLSLLPTHTPGKGVSALKGLAAYGLMAAHGSASDGPWSVHPRGLSAAHSPADTQHTFKRSLSKIVFKSMLLIKLRPSLSFASKNIVFR